ncbi:MAG TPA: hypothetical protein VJ900_01635 [Patescibacteria group bacterium]|nr:hypothetical protein [Patescibacteria group bacterium]
MYLFLNNLIKEKVYLALFDNQKKLIKERFLFKEKRAGAKLLKGIKEILLDNGSVLGDIETIVVVNGPGRFSAIRKALSVVNTIGWLEKIPVLGVSNNKGDKENKDLFLKAIKKDYNKGTFHMALPYYGKDPNIT